MHSEVDSSSETNQQPDTAAADTSPESAAAADNTGFVALVCCCFAGIDSDSTLLVGPKMRPGADREPEAAGAPGTGPSFHIPAAGIAAEQHSVGRSAAADCSSTDSTASHSSCPCSLSPP